MLATTKQGGGGAGIQIQASWLRVHALNLHSMDTQIRGGKVSRGGDISVSFGRGEVIRHMGGRQTEKHG